jgi:hypothetical protein
MDSPEVEELKKVEETIAGLCASYGVTREAAHVEFELDDKDNPRYIVTIDLPKPVSKIRSVITIVSK